MNCGCKENEEGVIVVFCRDCAAVLPQRIEDAKGYLVSNPDWLQARCGFATGSKVGDITKTIYKKGSSEAGTDRAWSTKRGHYADLILAERLTGKPQVGREVYSLNERAQLEPAARLAYEWQENCQVEQAGFIYHLSIERFGCSPDGLVGDDGMIEIKNFDAAKHIKLLEGDTSVLEDHMPQVWSGLACLNRSWCDFVSYCGDMQDEGDKLHITTFWADRDKISALECAVRDFLGEVDKRVLAVQSRSNGNQDSGMLAQLTGSLAILESPSKVVQMKRKRKGT